MLFTGKLSAQLQGYDHNTTFFFLHPVQCAFDISTYMPALCKK